MATEQWREASSTSGHGDVAIARGELGRPAVVTLGELGPPAMATRGDLAPLAMATSPWI
jgi:hypothetical protein